MKKFFVFLILMLMISSPALSATIKGGVSYTVESARIEAFDGVPTKMDMSKYCGYFIDNNYAVNMKVLSNGKTKYKNRILTFYSKGSYSVSYVKDFKRTFHYSKDGTLLFIDFIHNDDYPLKSSMYNIYGKLDSTCLAIKANEQYIFDVNKKLIAHWIGDNCYNEKGELINTRNAK